jgi:hypothetical protein
MGCRAGKPAFHPHQRRAKHAGQCGMAVGGGRLPTHNWMLDLQILTSGGYQRVGETRYHETLWNVDFFSAGSVCGSGEEPKAAQIGFGPAGTDEKSANNVGGKGLIRPMVMDHHAPTIRMAIDALAALALSELKALVFEGSNDTADRDVAEMRNRRMILTHTVTATTGSSMT